MTFSWDERKREENWQTRKVDFAEAVGIFDDPEVIESIDSREDYGEERIRKGEDRVAYLHSAAFGEEGCTAEKGLAFVGGRETFGSRSGPHRQG